MTLFRFTTKGGIAIARTAIDVPLESALESLIDALDTRRGVVLASSYEYPGRYKRWSLGFIDPPLAMIARGRKFQIEALNKRGEVLLSAIDQTLRLHSHSHIHSVALRGRMITGGVIDPPARFIEEERTRQPSIFSVLRALSDLFHHPDEHHLGLYGAFAYDLAYQFEPIETIQPRQEDQRDLVLYLPDRLLVIDYQLEQAIFYDYDFVVRGQSTQEIPRDGVTTQTSPRTTPLPDNPVPGSYEAIVAATMPYFHRGDLYEVVPSQSFFYPTTVAPSQLFRALRTINPSPYGFLLNLGPSSEAEYLVGASPEMFVRVEGRRIETCPISGTVARGRDAIEDAAQIKLLLNSAKDEAELTMCTDIDRNDKARVAKPGSVRVIGRRQIELYSHLIHTVDHVEGTLRSDCDALDAFLAHCWAVTVTGAPKRAAIQYLEQIETTPRRWYGGAIGRIGFDGTLSTGLTLRTMRLSQGIAELRVGATILADSNPAAEEREIHLKAAALKASLLAERNEAASPLTPVRVAIEQRPRILLVDCEDSFTLTLADYFRQAGGDVTTLRHNLAAAELALGNYDLLVLSPGPGRPSDFAIANLVGRSLSLEMAIFGVCLGLQGIVEALGGNINQLTIPYHGKQSEITITRPSRLFAGLPEKIMVGRYHSLFAQEHSLPHDLCVTARSEHGTIMAIEHRTKPISAVQFHPESIMSLGHNAGPKIIANVMAEIRSKD